MAASAQHLVTEEFENAYIQIFKKNYVLTKGEPDRKSLASTSEQGSMSIRSVHNSEVKDIMQKIINTAPPGVPKEPPHGIGLQGLSEYLVRKRIVINKETAFDVLKTHYCFLSS